MPGICSLALEWIHSLSRVSRHACDSAGLLHRRIRQAILEAACLSIRSTARLIITINAVVRSKVGRLSVTAKLDPNEVTVSNGCGPGLSCFSGRGLYFGALAGASLAAIGCGWLFGLSLHSLLHHREAEPTDRTAFSTLVDRIIGVESKGDPNAKNKRSSATGLGQFLNETWLDLIRAYRPELARGRSEDEILELRLDATLSREITARFAERNAAILKRRGLPVTAATVYLAHFAGAAGAVAILSAPANADAALVMANADATGRIKRDKIVKSNPFLEHFTVADLKNWADRKMSQPGTHAANAK